jgi:formamidopyrimidine-DNA glycosylase
MPELPEVQALVSTLNRRLAGLRLAALDVTAVSALKTADPPHSAVVGQRFDLAERFGKFLGLRFGDDEGDEAGNGASNGNGEVNEHGTWLVIHLARAGWLRLTDRVPTAPARPGRGPLTARLVFVTGDGEPAFALDLTEAGTRKGAALYVVRDPAQVPGIAALGPDALAVDHVKLAEILHSAGATRIKNALRDQHRIAGIGNAYSDEILHAARLSPYAPANGLTAAQCASLTEAITTILNAATVRAEAADPTSMKAEKKHGLRIHGRAGEPCPQCGTLIAEVALADRSFQYCPTCQTNGKPLADRRMSRLLK